MSNKGGIITALVASVLVAEQGHANIPVRDAYVFFQTGSDRLSLDAEAILLNFVSADQLNGRPLPLFIEGGIDRSSSERRDPGLACRRALAVGRFLIGRGIPDKDVIVRGYGPVEPLLNDALPQSKKARLRRVLVRYAGDAGRRLAEWRGATPSAC